MKFNYLRSLIVVVLMGLMGMTAFAAGGQPTYAPPGQNSEWDKSSVSVTGVCVGGVAKFTVTNNAENAMAGTVEYRVYRTNVLFESGNITFAAFEVKIFQYNSNGDAIRFEIDQRPGHPGNSRPRETLTCQGVVVTEEPTEVVTQAPTPISLGFTAECKVGDTLYWRVTNNSAQASSFTWQPVGGSASASIAIAANSVFHFTTPAQNGANTTIIKWFDPATNSIKQNTKAHNNQPCVYHVSFEKLWQGGEPTQADRDAVVITASSQDGLSTATCTYDGTALECVYARNNVAKADLEVPFGQSYLVGETIIDGWNTIAGIDENFYNVDGLTINPWTYVLNANKYCVTPQGALAKYCVHSVVNEKIEVVTEVPTDVVTEVPTDVVTEVPTDVVTEVPTDVVTEVPTDVVTEVPTDVVTEVPTDVVTEEPLCTPFDPKKDLKASIVFVSGNTYKAVITNSGVCDYVVGFASYEKYDNVLANQVLFSSVEGVAKPGVTTLFLEIPQCQAQLDVMFDASHNYEAYARGNASYAKWASKQAQLDLVPLILPTFHSNLYGPYGNMYSGAERLLNALHTKTPFCVEEEPTDVVTEEPTDVVTEVPTDVVTEVPTDVVTEEPTDVVTEVPTDVVTEEPTDVVTEEPTDVVTEEPTDVVTEVPTDVVTEVPTDVVTEEPTDVVTEVPTDVVTEVPTDVVTEEPNTCPYSFSNAVVSATQGLRKNGTAVLAERSNTSKAEGIGQRNDSLNFYSLGFGGVIVINFPDYRIANGAGDDVLIIETSFGDSNKPWTNYPEAVTVEASQDGISWTLLGTTNNKDQSYDLGSLSWASFIRLTDVTNPAGFPADADGFDVDSVEAINCEENEVPTEVPTDVVTEEPTDVVTEEPTDVVTEVPTDVVTEEPTEVVTEVPTDVVTEEPTEVVTEVPTEVVTEVPTEVVTEEPVCSPIDPQKDLWATIEFVSGNTYKAVIRNDGNCDYIVGFASYEKYDNNLANQVLFSSVEGVAKPGITELTLEIPQCQAQLDVVFDASHNYEAYASGNDDYNEWADDQADLDIVPLILPSFYSDLYGPFGNTYSSASRLLKALHTTTPFCGEEEPTEEPTDVVTEVPTDVVTEVPTDVVTEEPTDVVTEEPTDVVTEEPTDVVTEEPTDVVTEEPTDVVTEEPTDVVTEEPTDVVTEEPTDVVTEVPTDVVTEEPTEVVTEVPTEVVTEEPTEVVTEVPTEVVTETPTEVVTEVPTEVRACPKVNPNQHIWVTSLVNAGGNSYTATIINASDCIYTVGFASYEMPNDKLKDQVLFDSTTTSIGRGTHTLTITAPACKAQLDVAYDAIHNWEAARDGVGRYSQYLDDQVALDAVPVILPTFYSGIPFGNTYSEIGRLMKKLITDSPYCGVVATETPTEVPTEVVTEVPTELPTEVPTEVVTEVPTEVFTDAPTEVPTQVTEAPTEVPTQATEAPTEVPTQVTEAPTEVPTQATEAPTEAPTEQATEVVDGSEG